MKKQFPQFKYDKESEVLSLKVRRGRGVESDVSGNVVIDYDRQGRVVGINLYRINFDDFRDDFRKLKGIAKHSGLASFAS